jgi:hypothetical protein
VGSNVRQTNQAVDEVEAAVGPDADPFAAGLGVYLAAVSSNGTLDFKNNFRGQADAGFLGQAGNFAFGAASSHML